MVKAKHRYSSLLKLHELLLEKFPEEMEGIYFPPKKAMGNLSQVFIDERRTQLNCYLQAIASIACVQECKEVREMLHLQEKGVPKEAAQWLAALSRETVGPKGPPSAARSELLPSTDIAIAFSGLVSAETAIGALYIRAGVLFV